MCNEYALRPSVIRVLRPLKAEEDVAVTLKSTNLIISSLDPPSQVFTTFRSVLSAVLCVTFTLS